MITVKNFETRFPNNNLAYFNKLSDQAKEGYLKLYEKYNKLVLKYLLANTSLQGYDTSLKKYEDKYIPVDKENMDMYQYLCSDDLHYFYLRNNFYIERLTNEEMDYLKNADVNSDTNEFVEKTLQKVITELPDKDQKINLCFGSDSLKFFKPNGSIIIGARYDEFTDKIPDDDKWLNTYLDIKGKFDMIIGAFAYSNKSVNGIPIEVIHYNEYSTIGLNSGETPYDQDFEELADSNSIDHDKPDSNGQTEPTSNETENGKGDEDKVNEGTGRIEFY